MINFDRSTVALGILGYSHIDTDYKYESVIKILTHLIK